ncbi:unnamed protein product, partial [Iphiclides podalirius]
MKQIVDGYERGGGVAGGLVSASVNSAIRHAARGRGLLTVIGSVTRPRRGARGGARREGGRGAREGRREGEAPLREGEATINARSFHRGWRGVNDSDHPAAIAGDRTRRPRRRRVAPRAQGCRGPVSISNHAALRDPPAMLSRLIARRTRLRAVIVHSGDSARLSRNLHKESRPNIQFGELRNTVIEARRLGVAKAQVVFAATHRSRAGPRRRPRRLPLSYTCPLRRFARRSLIRERRDVKYRRPGKRFARGGNASRAVRRSEPLNLPAEGREAGALVKVKKKKKRKKDATNAAGSITEAILRARSSRRPRRVVFPSGRAINKPPPLLSPSPVPPARKLSADSGRT